MEPTDFKNVIVENIPPALSEVAEVAEVKQPWRPRKELGECFQRLHF